MIRHFLCKPHPILSNNYIARCYISDWVKDFNLKDINIKDKTIESGTKEAIKILRQVSKTLDKEDIETTVGFNAGIFSVSFTVCRSSKKD